ncbi:helix-turn-helix transcriptional regulator [Amycolatopsis saalfeldensis]|uniref:helix-turn-helix transcriptional regulator n=1 Tax=Amycolatopsis saalfeldensis TaxID=394193 RepID=UPI000B820DEE
MEGRGRTWRTCWRSSSPAGCERCPARPGRRCSSPRRNRSATSDWCGARRTGSGWTRPSCRPRRTRGCSASVSGCASAIRSSARAPTTRPARKPAGRELAATGQRPRQDGTSPRDLLTAQERLIAGKVAVGVTSKEVAATLFLSPRTIDTHLRNIYR